MNTQLANTYLKKVNTSNTDEPFLHPVEKPKNLLMKMVYYFSQKQFGKVMTPLSVGSARLPVGFGMFYGKVSKLDKKLVLPEDISMLIRQQVARINVCLFCMDISRYYMIQKSMDMEKFNALDEYKTSPLFTDAERAALDYVTELTTNKKADPKLFACMAKYYSEREICEIMWLVASEHLYNMTNIGLNIHSDMLCDISKKRRADK
jgi:alkylhydroperoxidase family enzyme